MAKPRPSEWGKLNAGQAYQVLALDVMRALFHAGLNHYELMLMQVVMEQSWYTSARWKRHEDDWPEAVPCKLNFTDFARLLVGPAAGDAAMKSTRKRLYEARSNLVASGLLREDDEGLWPVKDADRWTLPDGRTPRLDPGSLAYALSARNRRRVPEKPDKPCPEKRASVPGISDTRARKNGHECPEKRAFSASPQTPLLGKRERNPEDPPADAGAGACEGEVGSTPGESNPGPGRDSAEARALGRWAESLGNNWHFWAPAKCDSYPAEWVRAALEHHVQGASRRPREQLLNAILRRWKGQGYCDLIAAPDPAGHPPTVPIAAARVPASIRRQQEVRESLRDPEVQRRILEGHKE